MLKCPNCGADIAFNPATQTYICDYCSSEFTQEQLNEAQLSGDIKAEEQQMYEEKPETDQTASDDPYMSVIVYTCPQCGGELFTTEETAATFCSYCGSSVLLERRVSKELKPEFIIPFQITKEQAADIYYKKMKKSIFAPGYMRHMDIEKIRGIYMPYWTYTVFGNSNVDTKIKETTPAVGGMMVSEYQLSANINMIGDGIEYDSASTFPDDLSQSIAPYEFAKASDFTASYMSGFYADAGDVSEDEYKKEAAQVMKVLASEKAADKMGVSAGELIGDIADPAVEGQRAMYPVWFVAAKNNAKKKVSYAVVNGQTGKIAADIPVDNKKLLIGMLAIAVPLFAILYFLITPTPMITAICVLILSIVGGAFAISNMAGKKTGTKTSGSSATNIVIGIIGLIGGVGLYLISREFYFLVVSVIGVVILISGIVKASKGVRYEKVDGKYTLPLILSIAAVVICIIALIWNPVNDMYYYICIIAAGICGGCSYWSMFSIHNKGTLRKLPQLGKRGGDGA